MRIALPSSRAAFRALTVRQRTANLRHDPGQQREVGRPAGISRRCDQYFAFLRTGEHVLTVKQPMRGDGLKPALYTSLRIFSTLDGVGCLCCKFFYPLLVLYFLYRWSRTLYVFV